EEDEDDDGAGGLPGWVVAAGVAVGLPALALGLPSLAIVALKRRRRSRRRTRGTPSERVAGSFAELVDHVRDTGRPVPPRATRRELATVVGAAGAADLARRADVATFGADEPADADVDDAWAAYDEARASLDADLDRAARLRAAVSLTSLRAPR
ncbi:MAG TPA: hypothetical protein VFU14_20060, partial [Acidimicrobiales bacterium]|nr:hypothetical protein [Acidimicrobiales bacterium]